MALVLFPLLFIISAYLVQNIQYDDYEDDHCENVWNAGQQDRSKCKGFDHQAWQPEFNARKLL